MSSYLVLFEVIVVFGGLVAFCLYELRALKKSREQDASKAAENRSETEA